MRQVSVFLVAIALASAGTIEAMGDIMGMATMAKEDLKAAAPRRSRFLAARDPKGKKCDIDPQVCLSATTPGSTCCDSQCVDTDTDAFNCGKCGEVCKFTQSCCGGKCVDLAFDKRHCGKCFNSCKRHCFYGLCDYA
ncbi:stigma-specific STIG1-like protein 1 [Phoenix dactylifera]|uniref:Stigma-specific STIG1-like protein 1 n=1 Tax=Phoenix dactylifera TaxID=42345 RepID=A0A8B7BNP9_PHODC|nr:stigma-specific STIG1-like protein 1 [Phoenix dactylifera]